MDNQFELNSSDFEEDRYSRKAERIRKESDVYKNAGVTKSVFSKIRSSGYGGKTYNPSKATVMALIVGAHLSVNEAATLMEKAGFRFIQGEKTDEVVCDFLKRRDFDMDKLNRTLLSSRLKPLTGNAKQEHDERK